MTKTIKLSDWQKEVKSRGELKKIKFKCPSCGNDQSIEDFKALNISDNTIEGVFYFSCIGRFSGSKSMNEKPCNYTSGGLFVLNTLFVIDETEKKIPVFDFADNPLSGGD
ncbi:hypothetical protein KAR91_52150 [Candidatus Pacearchaeota archaeon]|nr:hypothetical protein [Candidatus Pacearchaeota archaeon]